MAEGQLRDCSIKSNCMLLIDKAKRIGGFILKDAQMKRAGTFWIAFQNAENFILQYLANHMSLISIKIS